MIRRQTISALGFFAAMVFLLAVTLSAPALGQERVRVGVRGEDANGYGRILLQWPSQAPAPEIETLNNVLIVRFPEPFAADLSNLRKALEPYVALARQDADGRTLRLALKLTPKIETEREGRRLAIDILPPSFSGARAPVAAEPFIAVPAAPVSVGPMVSGAPAEPQVPVGELTINVGSDAAFTRLVFDWSKRTGFDYDRDGDRLIFSFDHDSAVDLGPLLADGVNLVLGAERLEGAGTHIAVDVEPGTRVDIAVEGDIVLADLRPLSSELTEIAPKREPDLWVERGGEPEEHIFGPDPDAEMEAHAEPEPVAESEEVLVSKIAIEVEETGAGLHIRFPWKKPVPAAVFQRAEYLWAIFGLPAEIDLGALDRRHRGWVRSAEVIDLGEAIAVRMQVAGDALPTAEGGADGWSITLGDAILATSEPLGFERDRTPTGEPAALIRLPGADNALWVKDPEVGDEIGVVVAFPPSRGFVAPRKLADFQFLTTAHGIAVEVKSEDVALRVGTDLVLVSKTDGLAITQDPRARRVSARGNRGPKRSPGFIDFEGWKRPDIGGFSSSRQALLGEAASATGNGRTMARLELARFYLAHELNAEAFGMLQLVSDEDETARQNPAFRALRGVTNYLLARDKAALEDLTALALAEDGSAALWRGLAYARMLRWPEARREFLLGAKALALYAPASQARFRLAQARATLALNDIAAAEETLLALPKDALTPRQAAEAEFLRGRLAEGTGNDEGALTHYEVVSQGGLLPYSIEADLEKARLLLKLEAASIEQTIDALEHLRYRWRGDNLELTILNELGQLYIAAGDPRTGLETMRSAVTYFPHSPLTRGIADEMGAIFEELFLDGGADALDPVQALGLYYDFRELTPIGRKGDGMIRKMADRLVQVDLLPQAAELLNHQMRFRLKGVAKAQVAARLSIVQLLDRKPEAALQALEQSRQALLPNALAKQRRLLRSRALAALGRHDHALELLEDDNGEDAGRLRASILWEAEQWEASAAASEQGLGDIWRAGKPLDPASRSEVMRAAIAYSLASDEPGLARIRSKFARIMSESPDAQAFEIVTAPIERQGVEFRELVRQIAGTDAFETFMRSLRSEFDMQNAQSSP